MVNYNEEFREQPYPPFRANVLASGEPALRTSVDALHTLQSWYEEGKSNLAVVMGSFGVGKTTLLNKFAQAVVAHEDDIAAVRLLDFEEIRFRDPSLEGSQFPKINMRKIDQQTVSRQPLLIVDNFDALNLMTGRQAVRPDLRDLSQLLADGYRLLVATRRSLTELGDELVKQLLAPQRLALTHAERPTIVEMLPLDLDDLQEYLSRASTQHVSRVVGYLRRFPAIASDHLRRPLLLNMLQVVEERLRNADEPVAIADLYRMYVESALSFDYDQGRSRLNQSQKLIILSELAFDIFRGVERTLSGRGPYSVTYGRISERVLELVTQEPRLILQGRPTDWQWTEDFLSTNHVLVEHSRRIGVPALQREFEFAHPTIFEYFVAMGMLDRFARGVSLGLTERTLSEGTFRSLVVHFVRAELDQEIRAEIKNLARGRLAWSDRLIILSILERSRDFLELIMRAKEGYLEEIRDALPRIQSPFIRRMIRYQLVVAGRYDPYEYIAELRGNELRSERHITLGLSDSTMELIDCITNPSLQRAIPITVFLLGQFGDHHAVGPLQNLRADADEQLDNLTAEALHHIAQRLSHPE